MFTNLIPLSENMRLNYGRQNTYGTYDMTRSIQNQMASCWFQPHASNLDELGQEYGLQGFESFPAGGMNMNYGYCEAPRNNSSSLGNILGFLGIASLIGFFLGKFAKKDAGNNPNGDGAQGNNAPQQQPNANIQNPKIEDFSSWTNEALDPNSAYSYVLTSPKHSADMKAYKTLKNTNADKTKIDAEGEKVGKEFTHDLLQIAQEDIANNYDKNNDGLISEDEYINSELKQNGLENLTGNDMALAKQQSKVAFDAINVNKNGKDNKYITKEEYAAFLGAIDANNSTGHADGVITKDEFKKSSEMFSDQNASTEVKKFTDKENQVYKYVINHESD